MSEKLICLWCGAPTVGRHYCNNQHMKKNSALGYLMRSHEADKAAAKKILGAAKTAETLEGKK